MKRPAVFVVRACLPQFPQEIILCWFLLHTGPARRGRTERRKRCILPKRDEVHTGASRNSFFLATLKFIEEQTFDTDGMLLR
jgi:hypothetical protein